MSAVITGAVDCGGGRAVGVIFVVAFSGVSFGVGVVLVATAVLCKTSTNFRTKLQTHDRSAESN